MSENLDPIQMEDNDLSMEPAAAPEVAESTAEDESAENTVDSRDRFAVCRRIQPETDRSIPDYPHCIPHGQTVLCHRRGQIFP